MVLNGRLFHPLVFPVVKNPPGKARDTRDWGSIPGLGWSLGVWSGNPLQYSCLENSMGSRAWQTTVHGAAKSQTQQAAEHTLLSLSVANICQDTQVRMEKFLISPSLLSISSQWLFPFVSVICYVCSFFSKEIIHLHILLPRIDSKFLKFRNMSYSTL